MRSPNPWTWAPTAPSPQPSLIREILRRTHDDGRVLSLAGGLPAAAAFPVQALREACDRVLTDTPTAALQYDASEGYAPLRDWVAQQARAQGVHSACASRVLITHGSQQALDLVGRVLLNPGSAVAVESPSYLGALQAFALNQPRWVTLTGDAQGVLPEALAELPRRAPGTRMAYLMPTFHNPTGRLMDAARRQAVVAAAQLAGLPLLEDNPYGELWWGQAPPPAPLAALWPQGVLLLGSFSKVLAPGLRLGWLLAPDAALYQRLLQAKQATDLHSGSFNQRLVSHLLHSGLLAQHLPALRQRYAQQAQALHAALQGHLPTDCRWQQPSGGMFIWLRLPPGLDAAALLGAALDAGVAYVPGSAFHAPGDSGCSAHLRLSFATLPPAQLDEAVRRLAAVLQAASACGEGDGRGAGADAAYPDLSDPAEAGARG